MKVPLLEYLDNLEATAKVAPGGTWRGQSDRILSDGRSPTLGYDGYLVAESMMPTSKYYIVAMQPRATLALIAKLRELAILARRAREASTESPISWRELDDALAIEVPE